MRPFLLLFLMFLPFMVFLTGCTQPGTGIPSPILTPTPGPPPPDLSPCPTDPIPAEYRVFVTVSRGTLSSNPVIRVEFRGGPGMRMVSWIDAEVIRPDGMVASACMKTPSIRDFMEITGTTAADRVIVPARMMNGERYRIYDRVLEFRS